MSRVYLRFFHVVSSLISFFMIFPCADVWTILFLFVVLDVGYSQSCSINFRVGTLALVCEELTHLHKQGIQQKKL